MLIYGVNAIKIILTQAVIKLSVADGEGVI